MKKIILTIALIVPVGVFIFLRFLGKNEFAIPVYHESGVESPSSRCHRNYLSPYLVSDSLLNTMGWTGGNAIILTDSSRSVHAGLKRLSEEFNSEVQLIFPVGEVKELSEIYSCDLLLQSPWTAVLIDEQRRIRGYYDPEDREETDRLIVELKILLKQY